MARALDARDCIVAPITESGAVVGLLAVVNRLGDVGRFRDSDRTMFATLANHASVALENGRLIDRLHHEARERRHEALHDALTGLPNRVLFGSRLREQLDVIAGTGARLAVALMDLDGFKDINDTLGHQSGDIVLDEVAKRISYAVGPAAVVARLGGDEFALMFPSPGSKVELEAVARRVREEVTKPILVEGMRINVNVSIGFAVAPDDACDAAILLQRADVAMYSAKAGNGNGVDFYEALRDENSTRRLRLGNDLRAAIDDRQLSVAYQPKVRLTDGEVIGMEALVRWRHPVFGQVLPDEFIPLAERTGAISELTSYVLRTALDDVQRWHRAGRQWSVAVNVAMRNLLDGDFATTVGELLAESGVDPSMLTLEITETGVMSDASRTIDMLDRLAALGLNLSIDDFGTGYSSLSYLQQLPVTEIKIDKLFVSDVVVDPGAEAIVRSVLDLARNLNLTVVAEGVEDRRTWELLRKLGCTVAQGYFLARPMPVDDLEMWFKQLPAMDLADRRRHVPASRVPTAV
jgi:diguanylate cyclase (GGDEF)-like protein